MDGLLFMLGHFFLFLSLGLFIAIKKLSFGVLGILLEVQQVCIKFIRRDQAYFDFYKVGSQLASNR